MTTYVALLRAVNVSGQNRVPMAELRGALGDLGFARVETYVQSGNIVFEASRGEAADQAAVLHDLIEGRFGHDVVVLTLTAERLAAVAAANPFLGVTPPPDEKWLHVTFLDEPAGAEEFAALDLPAEGDEAARLAGDGCAVYLRLPYGYGRTKLSNGWFERALKTSATTRNWRTVLALVEMSARGS